MEEKLVKGTMLIDQVRMIRGNKQLNWDEYLEPEDWEIIKQRILPTNWYPLEIYRRCGWATFMVLAQGDLNLVRWRGQIRGKELFETAYKTLIGSMEPIRALERFVRLYGQLFNFSELEFEAVNDQHARIYHDYSTEDQAAMPYCYQLMGHFDTLIEMTGGRKPCIELLSKQWEGNPNTVFDLTWE